MRLVAKRMIATAIIVEASLMEVDEESNSGENILIMPRK
jgi:hypothetical protein